VAFRISPLPFGMSRSFTIEGRYVPESKCSRSSDQWACSACASSFQTQGEISPGKNISQTARMLGAQCEEPALLGAGSSSGGAGPRLDFPAQQFQGVAEAWVPFKEAIVIGWR
jgi:hypothetical protein